MGFRREPSAEKVRCPYEILRCKPATPLDGVVVSSDWVGADLHWWSGKSVLHSERECAACDAGNAYRWYGYFLGVPNGVRVVSIFEFTSRCFAQVSAYYEEFGSLRGAPFRLRRLGKQTNAPLSIAFSESRIPPSSLPEEKPLEPILARLWERNYVRSLEQTAAKNEPPLTNRLTEAEQVRFKMANDNGRHE